MAEKKVIEIEIQDNSKTLKQQYKEAVLEVQKLADAFGATSIEVQNASKKAAELKDQIEDVNDAIQSQKGEGAFIALGRAVSAVANGFSAVQGAMGLVGVESEEVQQAMLRVQSAMALAQGLEGLEDAGRAFKQLGVTVTSFGTKALSAFQAMSTASKAFLVTGIGLLIAGLGTAIAYWDDISKAIGLASDEQDTYAKQQKRINEQAKESRESVAKESGAFATLISRLKETNAGSKERDTLIKKINTEYGTTLKNLSDEAEFQNQLNNELKNYLEYQTQKFLLAKNEEKITKNLELQQKLKSDLNKEQQLLNKYQEDYQKMLSKPDALIPQNFLNNLEEQKTKVANINTEISNAEKRFLHYGKSANKASTEIDKLTYSGKKYVEVNKNVTDNVKEVEAVEAVDLTKDPEYIAEQERLQALNKLELDSLKTIEDAKKANQDMLLTEQELATQKENEAYKIKLDNAIKFGQDTEALEIEHLNNINNINLTAQEKAYENEKIAAENSKILKEKSIADAKELFEKNLKFFTDATVEVLGIISNMAQMQQDKIAGMNKAIMDNDKLTEKQKKSMIEANEARARKSFENAKKANIAATLISTFMSARQAYASQFLPMPDPTSPVRGAVAAGLSVAQGLMAVAKIKATQFNGGGGGGGGDLGGGGGGGGVIAPNLNVVGNTGINQLATLQQQPVKAYVVSNDITSAQQFDLKVQQTASL